MKSFDRQVLTARNQFIETSTQSVENTEFLILRFLHFLINVIKEKGKDTKMKKELKISRIVIAIITLIVSNIMFINEDFSWKIITPIFAFIAYIACFPGAIACKFLLKIGDNISNIFLKILYYVIIPIILLLFCLLIYWIGFLIFDAFPTPNELGPALGQALMFLFIIIVICMFIVIPYIQALIILVLRKIIESDENKNGK